MQSDFYFFDKQTLASEKFGEVQDDYNVSFVIDGTKDSAKVEVYSFVAEELEPNTIVYIELFEDEYFVVNDDRVELVVNEQGNIYKHTLQLVGAIELLNSRDLTDIGFNQNRYTIGAFTKRLFDMSNCKLPLSISNIVSNIDLNIVVDYTKTFENYTLLSALREFYDGYNCSVKLSFVRNGTLLIGLKLIVIPKTGNGTTHEESIFNGVRETKRINKSSFGTIVVSNAENVISSKTKTYPSVGTAKLSSNAYNVTNYNAILRLPSNVFKVNWVKMFLKRDVYFSWTNGTNSSSFTWSITYQPKDALKKELTKLINAWSYTQSGSDVSTPVPQEVKNQFLDQIDFIVEQSLKSLTVVFENNDNYDPVQKKFIVPSGQTIKAPTIQIQNGVTPVFNDKVYLTNKELWDNLEMFVSGFYWERGKNYLGGFDFLSIGTGATYGSWIIGFNSTELGNESTTFVSYSSGTTSASCYVSTSNYVFYFNNITNIVNWLITWDISFQVNYIPMSDIKIEYDNAGETNDIKLYNQNGRLTDGVALSKLLLSYSKEIESDNITKYGTFYNKDDIPNVGDIVFMNNARYVINNVSINVYQNEVDNHFVVEFNLSKQISVKSILTNPNTNVRDYGIPQNKNVKRKQLIRDFYEFDFESDESADTNYFIPITKILPLNVGDNFVEHTAIIKTTYANAIGGGGKYSDNTDVSSSDTWYYKIESTTFQFKKAIYEVFDFKDNNIIGYDSQNMFSGFDIRRMFNMVDLVNVPISYVDDKGELEGLYMAFCNSMQVEEIYKDYCDTYGQVDYSKIGVFIDSAIYNGSTSAIRQVSGGGTIYGTYEGRTATFDITDYINLDDYNIVDVSITIVEFKDDNTTFTSSDYYVELAKNGSHSFAYITINSSLSFSGYPKLTFSGINVRGFKGAKDNNDFQLNISDYNKDALEVPFIEYGCQIDDTPNVIVGENILDTNDNAFVCLYEYKTFLKGVVNQNNFSKYFSYASISVENSEIFATINNGVDFFSLTNTSLVFMAFASQKYNISQGTNDSYGSAINFSETDLSNQDLVIVRHTIYRNSTGVVDEKMDLMFIINAEDMPLQTDYVIKLFVNHWKLD